VIVRGSLAADRDAVRAIHEAAFGHGVAVDESVPEAVLFDALLDDGDTIEALCFTAEADGRPVGHVVCSTATVDALEVVALGPIGVDPRMQGNGIGSSLVHAVLAAADELDFPLVALLGSTAYYARFGFVPGSGLGIEAPDPEWGDYFQVRPLSGYDPEVRGRFNYAPAFALVS